MAGIRRRREALNEILSMFRTDWTRDHLLCETPTTDAAILSSPLQQLHSLAFETDLQFNGLSQETSKYDAMMSGESVVIPAFSKDGISAGYLLEESYGLFPDDVVLCYNGNTALRFVSQEENGSFVGFMQLSKVDILIHYTMQRRTCTFHAFGFPPDTVRSLVATGGDVITFEKAASAMVYSLNTIRCSLCGVRGYEPCSCPSQLRRPKSPLDLGAISHNIHLAYAGQEIGRASYEMFENGDSKKLLVMDAHHKIIKVPRHGSAKKLLNWAIGDVLKTMPISVARTIRSPLASPHHHHEIDSESTPTALDNLKDTFATPLLLESINHPVNTSDIPPKATIPDDPFNFPSVSDSETEPTVWPIDTPIPDSFWPPSVCEENRDIVGMDEITSGKRLNPSAIPSEPTVLSVIETQPFIPSSIAPIMASEPSNPNTAPTCTLNGTPVPIITAPRLNSVAIPIAPNKAHSSDRNPPEFIEEKMKKTAEELRAWKAYQRKIRNRESAARSNLARKQRRQELARQKKQKASTKVQG